jgi:ABC-type transporter Mla maintaining outer membrane lipid asymmetry ATPase subunit MlaF
MTAPILELSGVSKQYGALRPLRIEKLQVHAGDQVAILGLDQVAAEVLVSLITGASLPDSGQVLTFGRSTSEITDSTEWLTTLDSFGILSERAALLEAFNIVQNLAVPFTLEIEPPPLEVADRAAALAIEVGLPEQRHADAVGMLDAASRMQVRLARALALNPGLLLVEHPSASLPRHDVARFGRQVRGVAERRRLAVLSLTADVDYARAAAVRLLQLDAATGRVTRRS